MQGNKYKTTSISNISWICIREPMSGELMTLKSVNKINEKLKFPFRKDNSLIREACRVLCNDHIQSHSEYVCTACYPNLTEKTKKEDTNYAK